MTFAAGYELTFTNAELIRAGRARGDLPDDTPENLAACAALATTVRAAIGDHIHAIEDDGHGFPRHFIAYPDGYWIRIEIDPWCVEVTGRHLSLAAYAEVAPRLEQIFACARAVGLAPHHRIGGGHVHVDRASFASPRDLRNFLVDYWNHAELALGVLGFDPLNAPALAGCGDAARAALVDGLARFDAGEWELAALLAHVRAAVYVDAAPDLPAGADRAKYQAIAMHHPFTLEVRAVRPHRSFAEFLRVCELFAARVAFLRGRPPIPLRLERWPSDARMPRDLALDRFATYCAEMAVAYAPPLDWPAVES